MMKTAMGYATNLSFSKCTDPDACNYNPDATDVLNCGFRRALPIATGAASTMKMETDCDRPE